MAPLQRFSTLALAVALALGLASTAASAQDDGLEVCVDLTNDADGNRSFSDAETASAAGDIAHQVAIENCGAWDATIDVVVASLGGSEVTVCADLEGESLAVDDRATCEFELPGSGSGATSMVVATITRAVGNETDGTAEGSDQTTFTIGAGPVAPVADDTEEPTDAPTEDDADDTVAAGDLANTGVSSNLWLFGMTLTLMGFVLLDAGRRGHLVVPARAGAHRRREPNPLLLASRGVSRQARWIKQDLNDRRR